MAGSGLELGQFVDDFGGKHLALHAEDLAEFHDRAFELLEFLADAFRGFLVKAFFAGWLFCSAGVCRRCGAALAGGISSLMRLS